MVGKKVNILKFSVESISHDYYHDNDHDYRQDDHDYGLGRVKI